MQANLRHYRHLVVAVAAMFWLPTSVLFFIDRFGVGDTFRLQGIYYLSVVLAEVPSGWFSDRIGRVRTLQLAALWWIGSFAAFIATGPFLMAALGQVLLALGFAFLSGTEVTFHYDSLEALGRTDDFEAEEATARRGGMVMRAIAVLTGGALGVINLKLPFVATFAGVLGFGFISLRLQEPPRADDTDLAAVSFGKDLGAVVRLFRIRILGWLLVAIVSQVVLEHLASEFAGPYSALVLGEELTDVQWAPLTTGILAAAVSLIGAIAVRWTPTLRERFGVVTSLTLLAITPAITVLMMKLYTSWAVFALLALRNVQVVIAGVLVAGLVGRSVVATQRATFLSMTSLGGRLVYGSVLLSLSGIDEIKEALGWATGIAFVALGAIWLAGLGVSEEKSAFGAGAPVDSHE